MVKYISGVGYKITKRERDLIREYEDGYIVPLVGTSYMFKPEDINDIVERLKAGDSRLCIARQYGSTMYRLNKFLRENNVKIHHKTRIIVVAESAEPADTDIAAGKLGIANGNEPQTAENTASTD